MIISKEIKSSNEKRAQAPVSTANHIQFAAIGSRRISRRYIKLPASNRPRIAGPRKAAKYTLADIQRLKILLHIIHSMVNCAKVWSEYPHPAPVNPSNGMKSAAPAKLIIP
jgi:hypothetical protein